MTLDVNKTPDDLGPVSPKDLYPTSDIRFVLVQLGRLEERVGTLIDDNKAHKSDFRLILGGGLGAFLVLAGLYISGYMRLDDRIAELAKGSATTVAKLDDLLQRTLVLSPRR